MKKLLLFILFCPLLLLGVDEVIKKTVKGPKESEEARVNREYQAQRENIQKQRALDDADLERQHNAKLRIARKTIYLQPEQGAKLDFERYKKEDRQLQAQRKQEDDLREFEWQKEDGATRTRRAKEGNLDRTFKAASSDSEVDMGIEQTRNQRIEDINKERILQDFDIKAKRINEFKEKYPDFVKKAPWKTLLKLGDVKAFIDMSYGQRAKFIQDIRKSIAADFVNIHLKAEDIAALHDLIHVTMPEDVLTDEFKQQLTKNLSYDWEKLATMQRIDLQLKIAAQLKEYLTVSLDILDKFNNEQFAIKMKSDLNLTTLKTLKKVGIAALWILGTVAVVLMLAHTSIILGPILLSMEVVAIGAKIGFALYHKAYASEVELSKELQTRSTESFQKLVPSTTQLLDTLNYENTADTLGRRIKNKSVQVKEFIKNKVATVRNWWQGE